MPKNFSDLEHNIINILKSQDKFQYDGKSYYPVVVDKPTSKNGEPKTDVYFEAHEYDGDDILLRKISFKKQNYDFLENKISAERAEEILGSDWANIIKKSIEPILENFKDRKLIFKRSYGHTDSGSYTLGWRFEFVKPGNGKLGGKMNLTESQIKDIYSGTNLDDDKKNAIVDGKRIDNSGVADCILIDGDYKTIEQILDNLVDLDEYAKENDEIHFACKALNYRSERDKIEGSRPLSVFVDWTVKNDKLVGNLVFNEPLKHRGKEIEKQLKKCLEELNIKSVDDLNDKNVDPKIVLE